MIFLEHEGTYFDTVLLLKVFIFHLSQWTQTKKVFARCFEFSPERKFDKAALATDDCRKYSKSEVNKKINQDYYQCNIINGFSSLWFDNLSSKCFSEADD